MKPACIFRTAARNVLTASTLLVLFLSACQAGIVSNAQDVTRPYKTPAADPQGVDSTPPSATSTFRSTASEPAEALFTPIAEATATLTVRDTDQPGKPEQSNPDPSPTASLFNEHVLSAEAWKDWPVVPSVPRAVAELYQRGLALGNDPHAFSILGDCQSLPETFLGVYDTDPDLVASLPDELQETVTKFAGSFERQSPTIKGGTTAGAILWAEWHENTFTCQADETPLSCELRLHRPSIVIINLGTHYETRNITYLRKILDELIGQGIVPILSTKADNREMDDRLNLEMAQLAIEYDLPLWNFYAAVSDLPNNGVGTKEGDEHLGEIYLSEAGLERHRLTALQALAAVWQAIK